MSVFIDVWHRTHPLTPEAHSRFLDYYGRHVVAPPSDYFEVVGGFRYTDGSSNEDFALYRYDSMAKIEESMMSFGADAEFISATEALFADIEIEETRAIAIHAPYSSDERIDELISQASRTPRSSPSARSHRFQRIVRTCGGTHRVRAFEALGSLKDGIEKAGSARLVCAFHYLVGPVMDLVELWMLQEGMHEEEMLPEAGVEWPADGAAGRAGEEGDAGVEALRAELARIAPVRERRGLEATAFSRLR